MSLILKAFRIQNFRSIIDTGWHNLSSDNITAFIGQNESGKTSILDGIYSFFNQEIKSDDIRSDDTFPIISCSFVFNSKKSIRDLIPEVEFADDFVKIIKEKGNRINIKCTWQSQEEFKYLLEEEDVRREYIKVEKPINESIKKISESIQSIKQKNEKLNQNIQLYTANMNKEPDALKKQKLQEKISSFKTEIQNNDTNLVEFQAQSDENTKKLDEICTEPELIEKLWGFLPDIVIFKEETSLLPDKIDLTDLEEEKKDTAGYQGAINFLRLANIEINTLKTIDKRILENKLSKYNDIISDNFQSFWTQLIGKKNKIRIEFDLQHHDESVAEKAGKPYLVFWIKDGDEQLYLKQRSNGVRWFLSFFLQLQSSAIKRVEERTQLILLVDEPGASLHARAQEDAIKIFEEIKDKNIQIIYTTHSPYFIDIENLQRLIAVQRNEKEDISDTKVFSIHELKDVSNNTLAPIYTIMGVDFSNQNVIKKKNNIVLEEVSAFYYLKSFWKLTGKRKEISLIPSKGTSSVEQLVYMFLGWGLEFIVVLDDDTSGRRVYNTLKKKIFQDDEQEASKIMCKIKDCQGIEDLFTNEDYHKIVLQHSTKTTEANSEYAKKNTSKAIIAAEFNNRVKKGEIIFDDFKNDTKDKIKEIIEEIETRLN